MVLAKGGQPLANDVRADLCQFLTMLSGLFLLAKSLCLNRKAVSVPAAALKPGAGKISSSARSKALMFHLRCNMGQSLLHHLAPSYV